MTSAPKAFLALGLAANLLAGCAGLEPTYRRPAMPTPATFPEAAAPSTGASESLTQWRRFVLDPKLSAVIELALANNRDLRVAIANVEAARAQFRVQRADLLPHVAANAAAVYGRQQTEVFAPAPTIVDYDEHQYSASLALSSYELDLFGRVRSLTKSALEQYLATQQARRAAQISLISTVADAYLTLAADEAILKAAQDSLASSQASLEVTQQRLDHGVASALDVAQARTQAEQTRAAVANDLVTVAQDHDALDLAVGAPTPTALLPDALGDQVLVLNALPAGMPSSVLLDRPDVLEAEDQLKSANAKIGAARAAFFPTITLTGQDGFTSAALSSLFKGPAAVWSFTPQVSLPIFAGGANVANLDYAKAEQRVALAQYEKAIQSGFRDVADALARRSRIDEQIQALEAARAAAAASLSLAQARFDRGGDTYLNLLIAQRTLYSADQALASGRLLKNTNLVALYTALGGGAA